jgi:glycosyltransferase involved in cell wall biosynthesis
MTRPSFAAALPIGSWHPLLPRSLASLAVQGERLHIALLDASGDPRVAEAAEASGLVFAYRRAGPDAGQSAAIVEGWSEVEGDVLFWLNADDQLLPGALKTAADAFEAKPAIDVVYGGAEFVDIEGARLGLHDQVSDISELLLRSNIIAQPSCFARRAAVEAAGGLDPDLHFVMDWDLWVRLYRTGAVFARVEDILSAVFTGTGTKTEQISRRRLSETFALVRRNAGAWAALKSAASLAAHTLTSRRRAV